VDGQGARLIALVLPFIIVELYWGFQFAYKRPETDNIMWIWHAIMFFNLVYRD
jgi:hypothetical protein